MELATPCHDVPVRNSGRLSRLVVAIMVLAVCWLALVCWIAMIPRPRVSGIPILTFGSSAVAGLATWWALRHEWFRRVVVRMAVVIAASTLVVSIIATWFLLPIEWSGELLGYVVLAPLAVAVLIIALVRARRYPADSAVGILGVLAFAAVLVFGSGPLGERGLHFRIHLVSSDYRSEAARLIASEPSVDRQGDGVHVVAREIDGDRAMVGWVWVEGIPARSYGVVYDPDGLIDDRAAVEADEGPIWTIRLCDHVTGPWYYCRLY
jgi:hypothetical protein